MPPPLKERQERARRTTERALERLGLSAAAYGGGRPAERCGPYLRLSLDDPPRGLVDVWCRAMGLSRWAVVVHHVAPGVRTVFPDLETAMAHVPGMAARRPLPGVST